MARSIMRAGGGSWGKVQREKGPTISLRDRASPAGSSDAFTGTGNQAEANLQKSTRVRETLCLVAPEQIKHSLSNFKKYRFFPSP